MEQFPFAVDDQVDIKGVPSPRSLSSNDPGVTDDGSVMVIPHEATEFAYINVTDEDEVDIWMEDSSPIKGHGATTSASSNEERTKRSHDDILSLLWTAAQTTTAESLVLLTEKGHDASKEAATARAKGNLKRALEKHGEAAQYFLEAAQRVREKNDATLTQPLLLLSQSEAEAATSLQRILQLPQTLRKVIARKHKPEADLSASTFLQSAPNGSAPPSHAPMPEKQGSTINPMEEMLELERELRDMDMALAVSSSIASLDARSRRSVSVADSFMVVPPSPIPKQIRTTTKRPREKQQQQLPVEDWQTASQILVAPAAPAGGVGAGASPKQVMQLMDTIRTVGNENAALLRRVEQAEADRQAAIAARAAMERFQQDYARRFAALKQHLPQHAAGGGLGVDSSMKHQEELIRKLTAELKREKEENRRKNAAIKKYEDFYKAVRARSAEKKKQQQVQEQQNRKVAEVRSGATNR